MPRYFVILLVCLFTLSVAYQPAQAAFVMRKTIMVARIDTNYKCTLKKEWVPNVQGSKGGWAGIVGFIFGVLSFSVIFTLFAIPLGIIFGAIGMQKNRKNREWAKTGFMLALIALGILIIVGVLILVLLAQLFTGFSFL